MPACSHAGGWRESSTRIQTRADRCPGVDRKRVAPYGMRRRDGIVVRVAAGGGVSSFPDQSHCRMQETARGMEPLTIDRTHILVLNYNGRGLLAECLPSIVEAAHRSPVPCRVTVVDNGSTDGSAELVASDGRTSASSAKQNLGLASFNRVLERLDEPVVLLLNNDIKLDPDAVGPLLDVFEDHDDALFSAPLCWTFDGRTYEGMRTRVRSRFGLVQGMCRVPGFERRPRQARPHRGGRARAGGRSPAVPRARWVRPDLFPGPDRRPRPGIPRLDGRLPGLLRARVGGLPPGVRHVRPQLGKARLRPTGQPQHADFHLEEHRAVPG